MKSKNRIFFPSVRAALIALAASAMFACSDDDEGFADLAVDSPSLEIQAGQTGLVRILAGSGEYTCTGNNPQIADVQLAEPRGVPPLPWRIPGPDSRCRST